MMGAAVFCCRFLGVQVSNENNPGCLGFIGDYTDHNKLL